MKPGQIHHRAAGSIGTHLLRKMGEQGVRRVVAALRRHGPQTFHAVRPVRAVGAFQAHLGQTQGRQQPPDLPRRLRRRLGGQGSNDRFHLGQPVAHRCLQAARTAQPVLKLRPTARRRSHVQSVAVLAALDPHDQPTDAKDKGRLVASYIDRWYALRILQDLPVQSADADALVHTDLVPLLRGCRTVADVASALGDLAHHDGSPVREAVTLGLRGNNAAQIRYLLARATAYADEACKKTSDILAYLDRDQFHIEHLWASHHHRVADDIPDPVVFRSRRNQLGGLGLLRGRENSSINDLPFHDKTRLYARGNVLLGVMAPEYDRRNPELRDFIKTHQLDKHLRAFGTRETMTTVIATRQELYLRLFEHIWNPERLGLPTTAAPQPPSGGSSRPPAPARPLRGANRLRADARTWPRWSTPRS